MIDDAQYAPTAPQPAATRDGVPLAPLAGGFLPPYTERLHLLADLPAPTPEAITAAIAMAAGDAVSQKASDRSETSTDDPDNAGSDDSSMTGAPSDGRTAAALEATRAMDAWSAPFGDPEDTHSTVEDRRIEGPHGPIPLRIYRPEPGWTAPAPSPADDDGRRAGLVWYHGGAFVAGDLDMPEADAVARGIVTRTGATVVSVFYRLCNDGATHHPVPHDDACAAFRWTSAHAAGLGVDPARLAVGGASAGGCLAAGVALRGRDDGAAPWQALLAYPVLHAEHWPAPSEELADRLEEMPQVLRFPADVMAALNANLLGGPVRDVPAHAFPGETADLAGYPPTYIENCENDDLRASGEAFARRLAAAGADVECVTCAGVPHGHLNAVGSPLTARSLDRFAARLARAR